MKKSDIERHKSQLLAMRTRLISSVQRIEQSIAEDVRAPGDLSNAPTHPATEAEEGVDQNVAMAENQETLLEQVEAALGRVEAGVYGRCEQCRRKISDERLDALPFTPYCVKCAASRAS
jgi:RNA polymerase-binding transcription factor DksA